MIASLQGQRRDKVALMTAPMHMPSLATGSLLEGQTGRADGMGGREIRGQRRWDKFELT